MDYLIDFIQMTAIAFAIPLVILGTFWLSIALIWIVMLPLSLIGLVFSPIFYKIKPKDSRRD